MDHRPIPRRPHRAFRARLETIPIHLRPRLPLIEKMVAGLEWDALSDVFDQVLLEKVGRWEPTDSGGNLVEPFVMGDRSSTSTIAKEQCRSIRQVERRVRVLSGTSPKRLACLSRFQMARDSIWANPSIELIRLSVEAGYSDQSHMTRDFKRFCGQTPARFARDSAKKKEWLANLDVAFVQDPTEPRE